MRITILGCGGSSGVPVVGNIWGACDPDEPRNRRLRPSILVEHDGTVILVDTGPDLRQQLLAARVSRIDAVLYTHPHADHCHGIDELREINRLTQAPIPVYGDARTLAEVHARFGYCFLPLTEGNFYYKPVLTPHVIEGGFRVGAIEIQPFTQDHGFTTSIGFRFGAFAYSTDVWRFDEAAFAALAGIEAWVVDCVRVEPPHPVHAHLALTLSWIERVKPRRAWLTHMNHTLDYRTLANRLPAGVAPAYDGLVIEVP
ncbi:MAG: MBL fold metallo-hydrolase [Azospirillum sp.]|nr:MBL fold metallo-hydrolase [Azospirillum sp.]